ncbi:prenyltransferase/squalene oxidase repeat-containing protein [Streptomyces sp. NPDC057430]|uniref:prenyltransferase/squalene oxidase repeat-containing protein n=1 Tax=unclassified Streptomyces TaxID=2593676 RepID=UPI00369C9687
MTEQTRRLDPAVAATMMRTLLTQCDNGSWASRPAPRVVETAVAAFALASAGSRDSRGVVSRARAWLFRDPPRTTAPAGAVLLEEALWSLGVDDGEPVRLPALSRERADGFGDRYWFGLLVQVLAVQGDRPVTGGLPLPQLRDTVRDIADRTAREREDPRHAVEALAAHVLLERPLRADEAGWRALERLMAEQAPDGSYGEDVIATALALLALGTVGAGGEAWRRARDHLIRVQDGDGAWPARSADVIETALTVRVFHDDPAFAEHALPGALAFLRAAQRDDGGWGATQNAPSDASLTGLVLSALAGLPLPRRTTDRACSYLARRQNADGLWGEGRLGEETVAHVVAGLRLHRHTHRVPYEKAQAWLTERVGAAGPDPDSGWILGLPYAVHRTVDALGSAAPEALDAVRVLATLQNADGGWPQTPGAASTPAATGTTLAVLEACGALTEERRAPALDYLLAGRNDGTGRPGALTETVGPWPLPVRQAGLTRAFAAWGLTATLGRACAGLPA